MKIRFQKSTKSVSCLVILYSLFLNTMATFAQLQFIAHRGASYLAPENTLASANLAWQLESDAVECDIMLTRDEKIVVIHDSNAKRLLGLDLEISETNYRDIKNANVKLKSTNLQKYSGEKVPLLKDLLQTIPQNRLLVIEIKCGPEILPHLKKSIKKHWKTGNIAFIAFDYETIIQAKKTFPDISCYFLSSALEDLNKRFEEVSKSDLDGVDLNHNIIDADLVSRFTSVGKEVWCWTVNTPEDAKRMETCGVHTITTDRPQWLREKMKQ
jgi:glycerophosphoryl diester phosphodiesterase